MTPIITKDSHLDHGLTGAQISYLLNQASAILGSFTESLKEPLTLTLGLPESLGAIPCALRGPIVGEDPILEIQVHYASRGSRAYPSRLVKGLVRQTQDVTFILGPHEGHPCVLYTVFGGPLSPKEPQDPTLREDERAESESFWRDHALASPE